MLRPLDFAALALAVILCAGSAWLVYVREGGESRFVIWGGGVSWVYPAKTPRVLAVPGPLGDTVVELRDGRAWIVSSPCANQSCVASGSVAWRGQWLACLPNRVMVSVEDGGEDGIDATTW